MSSPFTILENAELVFSMALSTVEDPLTGNIIPGDLSSVRVTAYFKKVKPQYIEGQGIDRSRFDVTGYAIDPNPLPDWCKNSKGNVPCWITGVGQGYFRWEPKLHVAKSLVESVTGTQLQGTFVLDGGLNESSSQL